MDDRFSHLIGINEDTLKGPLQFPSQSSESVPVSSSPSPLPIKFPLGEPDRDPMSGARDFSPIDPDFLRDLNIVFPETGPRWGETHAALLYRAGQRSVVEWLLAEYLAQQQKHQSESLRVP